MHKAIIIFFFFMVIFAFSIIGTGAFLGVKCYTSNDPNSMACFMISQRNEIGIRYRN